MVPPSGAAAQIIKQFKAGKVVSPDNVSAIKEALFYFYKRFEKKEISSEINTEDLKLFEKKQLTSRLTDLFEAVCRDINGRQ